MIDQERLKVIYIKDEDSEDLKNTVNGQRVSIRVVLHSPKIDDSKKQIYAILFQFIINKRLGEINEMLSVFSGRADVDNKSGTDILLKIDLLSSNLG